MYIFVGSHNPVKINAVITASSETWPTVTVEGIDVASGISEQPISDAETKLGASNRSKNVLAEGIKKLANEKTSFLDTEVLGIGLEGGVYEDEQGLMWSTVWGIVTDMQGKQYFSNGARFLVPEVVAQQIRAGGEMGPIISSVVGESDIRKKQGMIGIITNGFVDRTEEYANIAKLALGLWYGKDWLVKHETKKVVS